MEKVCDKCGTRGDCKKPCKAVNDILWKDNRVMERHFDDAIIVYPKNGEVHFSGLQDYELDRFSNDAVIPWSSGDARLQKTIVFMERFFNKVPCKDLAERFGVKENTIVCLYRDAVKQVDKIIEALDSRREGLKATKPDRFTDDQKFFLLVCVFGFSGAEVARMFNGDPKRVNLIVKRMADRFQALFIPPIITEILVEDPPINGNLTRADLVSLVEAYTEQGLSHRQAFKRIAERYEEIVGRPVKFRGIESRYYKAIAATT